MADDETRKDEQATDHGGGAADDEATRQAAAADPGAAAEALEAFEEELAEQAGADEGGTADEGGEPDEGGEADRDGEPDEDRTTDRKGKEDGDSKASGEAGRPPVVVFDKVTKTFAAGKKDAFTAIKDVSFVVEDLPEKGEFICILGPAGRVEVFGRPVTAPGADRGMVFQSYTSFDNRTVLKNVAFGLECRGTPRKEREELAQDWIDKVGLSVKHDAGKYPHQLSGGMQQRVAIARTLILHPKIILMDEPFGALDPVTRLQMQDMLVALWRHQEATVFFVTHSIEEAVYLGDRVYLFSSSPGTILRELDVPPPDRPAIQMHKESEFQNVVFELSELIHRMEREQAERERREADARE